MKILIVEDDEEAAVRLIDLLEGAGHLAAHARTGREGLALALAEEFDVIALDRMLPDVDGLSVAAALRHDGVSTPVLFLSNLSGVDDRVEGLEAGGDDYLPKPYADEELLARLAALARRPALGAAPTKLRFADLEMDLIARKARRAGQILDLRGREWQLLEYFLRSEGRVVTRKMLLQQVWNFHFDPRTNIVETHLSRLRSKIDQGREPSLIQTVRGLGYCLRETP